MMSVDRPEGIKLGDITLSLPVFFPSISTVKTALSPTEYLSILHSLRGINGQLLISAFDLGQNSDDGSLAQFLVAASEAGLIVLMDSGNYESYWKGAQSTWKQTDFHDALGRFTSTFAFGFDEQSPPTDENVHVELVVERWRQDQAAADRVIVPIVHGTGESLPALCVRVVYATDVPMIAVPERRLGDGIFERVRSVIALRNALNDTGRYVGLHLLGTGNPISIALYAWAGADSFDGLEWCQTVVDHETGLLFHLSQSDFFRQQTEWGDGNLSFQARTLAHNLAFYSDWMQRLRRARLDDEAINFCRLNFPPHLFRQCATEFGWEDPV